MSGKSKPSDATAQAPAPKRARWDSDIPSTAANGVNGAAAAAAPKPPVNLAERAAHLKLLQARLADRLSQSKSKVNVLPMLHLCMDH